VIIADTRDIKEGWEIQQKNMAGQKSKATCGGCVLPSIPEQGGVQT
jgi:hypothetical protein